MPTGSTDRVTEPLVLLITAAAAGLLLRPVLIRVRPPGWFVRARERGRPGLPVTVVLGTGLIMTILWLIGERRGAVGVILLSFWIGTPLAAWIILRSWLARGRRPKDV